MYAAAKNFWHAADSSCDDRKSKSHGFQKGNRARLVFRTENECVKRSIEACPVEDSAYQGQVFKAFGPNSQVCRQRAVTSNDDMDGGM